MTTCTLIAAHKQEQIIIIRSFSDTLTERVITKLDKGGWQHQEVDVGGLNVSFVGGITAREWLKDDSSLMIKLYCKCGYITHIYKGDIIRCRKCGFAPNLTWDGHKHHLSH